MSRTDCFYCKKDEQLTNLMIEICKMPSSILYLNRDQTHKGRCIIAFHSHKRELFELSEIELTSFMKDVSIAAEAIQKVFQADKINYAIYGDLVSHLHFHLVPKYKGKTEWGEAFVNSPESKVLLNNSENKQRIEAILDQLNITRGI
ncbi:HIT family protein [Neobacillus drentensis]|uniref:HIT family protein n=1 Tax=Neobacillus drentensis TaxID=220684 RepID=UPI002FFF4013